MGRTAANRPNSLHSIIWSTGWYVVACAACVVGAGCGASGPLIVPIRGTVTFQGKPLNQGTVEFVPQSPQGRKAMGRINADGSYQLTTFKEGDGALEGDYRVVVVALAPHPGEPTPEQLRASGGVVRRGSLIPERYGDPDASGLTDRVSAEHSGVYEINLTQ